MKLNKIFILGIILVSFVFVQNATAQLWDPVAGDPLTNITDPLWVRADQPQSLTNQATAGVFTTDVDNFMDVKNFQEVDMERYFIFLQAGPNLLNAASEEFDGLSFGLARRFGRSYLGFFYSGSIVERDASTRKVPANANSAMREDSNAYWRNTLSILFGNDSFGGLKLDLLYLRDNDRSRVRNNSNPGALPGDTTGNVNQEYRITEKAGNIGLGLTWGNAFEVGNGVLKPEIGFSYLRGGTTEMRQVLSATNNITRTDRDNSYFAFFLGAEYEFERNDNRQSTLSLVYRQARTLYPNIATQTLWVSDAGTIQTQNEHVIGKAARLHTIEVDFDTIYDVTERLQAGYRLGLIFGYFSAELANVFMQLDNTGTIIPSPGVGWYTDEFFSHERAQYTITPTVGTGFIYQLVQDRFNLNGGFAVQLPTYTRTVERDTRPPVTSYNVDDRTMTWSPMMTSATIGATLFITPGFEIDMLAGSIVGGAADVDVSQVTLMGTIRR
ncbi:MAG: hypothetical protein FWD87_06375 [Spirochaetaceae bacterium]|nr:hypothetical protein [Spirochaetaceae bacterium]